MMATTSLHLRAAPPFDQRTVCGLAAADRVGSIVMSLEGRENACQSWWRMRHMASPGVSRKRPVQVCTCGAQERRAGVDHRPRCVCGALPRADQSGNR